MLVHFEAAFSLCSKEEPPWTTGSNRTLDQGLKVEQVDWKKPARVLAGFKRHGKAPNNAPKNISTINEIRVKTTHPTAALCLNCDLWTKGKGGSRLGARVVFVATNLHGECSTIHQLYCLVLQDKESDEINCHGMWSQNLLFAGQFQQTLSFET